MTDEEMEAIVAAHKARKKIHVVARRIEHLMDVTGPFPTRELAEQFAFATGSVATVGKDNVFAIEIPAEGPVVSSGSVSIGALEEKLRSLGADGHLLALGAPR
jgi:hypothetical protein